MRHRTLSVFRQHRSSRCGVIAPSDAHGAVMIALPFQGGDAHGVLAITLAYWRHVETGIRTGSICNGSGQLLTQSSTGTQQ